MPQRRRLDRELVTRGLAPDPQAAAVLIADQRVTVEGAPALQATRLVAPTDALRVLKPAAAFVTRGGAKLAGALDDLAVSVAGRQCLDAGAGAGGFTDCLLQRGAVSVVAVDVGYGDFAWALRQDPRVRLLERCNIRTVDPALLGGPFDLVVADLSFISLAAVAPGLVRAAGPGADLVLLVKPQFEAPRDQVPAGGIIADPAVWTSTLERVAGVFAGLGMGLAGVVASRLRGAEGNQEFFVWERGAPGGPPGPEGTIERAVAAACS